MTDDSTAKSKEHTPDEPDASGLSAAVELPSSGRIAGIDFGTVRIGVSICDEGQIIASPLETYNRRTIERDAQYFVSLVESEKIAAFVVGLPVHMSGDESQKSREAVSFGNWLSKVTGLPVDWIDERYTSAMAREMMRGSSLSGKKRKQRLDKLAAQIILSAYLEARSNKAGQASPELRLDD